MYEMSALLYYNARQCKKIQRRLNFFSDLFTEYTLESNLNAKKNEQIRDFIKLAVSEFAQNEDINIFKDLSSAVAS